MNTADILWKNRVRQCNIYFSNAFVWPAFVLLSKASCYHNLVAFAASRGRTVLEVGGKDFRWASIHRKFTDLKQPWEDMKCIDSTRSICIWQHLIDVAAPGLLLIIICHWLESCQYGRKKWRRRRGSLHFWETILFFFILATNSK